MKLYWLLWCSFEEPPAKPAKLRVRLAKNQTRPPTDPNSALVGSHDHQAYTYNREIGNNGDYPECNTLFVGNLSKKVGQPPYSSKIHMFSNCTYPWQGKCCGRLKNWRWESFSKQWLDSNRSVFQIKNRRGRHILLLLNLKMRPLPNMCTTIIRCVQTHGHSMEFHDFLWLLILTFVIIKFNILTSYIKSVSSA